MRLYTSTPSLNYLSENDNFLLRFPFFNHCVKFTASFKFILNVCNECLSSPSNFLRASGLEEANCKTGILKDDRGRFIVLCQEQVLNLGSCSI